MPDAYPRFTVVITGWQRAKRLPTRRSGLHPTAMGLDVIGRSVAFVAVSARGDVAAHVACPSLRKLKRTRIPIMEWSDRTRPHAYPSICRGRQLTTGGHHAMVNDRLPFCLGVLAVCILTSGRPASVCHEHLIVM